MKLLVLYAFVAVAGVAVNALITPQINQKTQDVKLLRYESNNDGLGTYSFVYDQSDSSSRNEEGELRNAGTKNEFVAVKGSYSWMAPDGVFYSVNYIADENGFQPTYDTGPLAGPPPDIVALLGL